MSSTKPITSAEFAFRRAAVAVLAVAVLATAAVAGSRAWGAILTSQGRALLTTALNVEDPALKAEGFAAAQGRLIAAARYAAGDSQIWGMLAHIRLLQATSFGNDGGSQTLLAAARANADRAIALSPHDPRPLVLGAEIALAEPGADRAAEAAARLIRSYEVRAVDPSLGILRTDVVFSAWAAMPPTVQEAALAEACVLAGRSIQARDSIASRGQSAMASNADALAERLRQDVLTPRCLSASAS